MRLLIAINFDEETKGRMLAVQDRLRAKLFGSLRPGLITEAYFE